MDQSSEHVIVALEEHVAVALKLAYYSQNGVPYVLALIDERAANGLRLSSFKRVRQQPVHQQPLVGFPATQPQPQQLQQLQPPQQYQQPQQFQQPQPQPLQQPQPGLQFPQHQHQHQHQHQGVWGILYGLNKLRRLVACQTLCRRERPLHGTHWCKEDRLNPE